MPRLHRFDTTLRATPRCTISSTLPIDAAITIDRTADTLRISRSQLVALCIEKAMPAILAEAAATLSAAQLPVVTLPPADLPEA